MSIRWLLAAFGCVVLSGACGSGGPTSPSGPPIVTPGIPPGSPAGPGPSPIAGTPIAAGVLVEASVDGSDPVCFPNWDARGHCRQYDLTAASDGVLMARLQWPGFSVGPADPDLFLVGPDGVWNYAEDDPVNKDRQVKLPAKAQLTYRIVVLSYGSSPQPFGLVADVH
jgi:hypothetical protein